MDELATLLVSRLANATGVERIELQTDSVLFVTMNNGDEYTLSITPHNPDGLPVAQATEAGPVAQAQSPEGS